MSVAGLTPNVKRVTPRLVYEGSNAINYAYLRSVGIMLGQNLVRDYTDSAIVELGKRLVEPRGFEPLTSSVRGMRSPS